MDSRANGHEASSERARLIFSVDQRAYVDPSIAEVRTDVGIDEVRLLAKDVEDHRERAHAALVPPTSPCLIASSRVLAAACWSAEGAPCLSSSSSSHSRSATRWAATS